jgi:serine/threonine protein kinase
LTEGLLSGRYRLAERIGEGGFSNVYKAEDRILERQVAVKVLAEHLSDDERFVARFRREALAVAKLIHPNVVPVYDTGVVEGRHYLVMELIDGGGSCAELLRDSLPPPEAALDIVIQVATGLDYAHRRGVIHCDVKPSNLMIVRSAEEGFVAKVTDFGIATAADWRPLSVREPVIGTKGYLCPEAWWGEPATPRFDVYALGVVAYQLIFGGLPVRDETGAIAPPDGAADGPLAEILPVLERALADSPANRLGSCGAFAEEMRAFAKELLAAVPQVVRRLDLGQEMGQEAPQIPADPSRSRFLLNRFRKRSA